ncbi:hypothetical protein D9615_003135 [Tricholomella constricta]|uniref:Uncharacterized protein n=1 Tax=Tricholomella constricta TaxID=117010 RepID=A0A8H5HJD3_9AGAR|nr:hypothetical protein D9615_003135 [Tricholomella constricta]
MIISSLLSIGQITFILRVAIQILTYAGLAIIGILILGSAPRVASISTHDTLNRIIGASSATKSTIKWIFTRIRRNQTDPTPPTHLLLILFLSLSYTIFTSLSDIGFLGFYACSVPGPNTIDSPASINSVDAAQSLVLANMINGTDLSKVKTYRCNSSSLVPFVNEVFSHNCTAWRNGTYADREFFSGLNITDTDALMPRQLARLLKTGDSDINTFYLGPTTHRLRTPVIEKGLAIEPHATGFSMVVGVPQLQPNTKVELAQTMAVEMDVGCMSLGIFDSRLMFDTELGQEFMRTNGTWRQYTGPDYMRDVLGKTVDNIRTYFQPFFNSSSLDAKGLLKSINGSNIILSGVANVATHRLPTSDPFASRPDSDFMGNCTEALQRQLSIPQGGRDVGSMCSLLGIGGTHSVDGAVLHGLERMVCATATRVSMVAATIQVDAARNMSLDLTRLPSDLTYVLADYYWDTRNVRNDTTEFSPFVPYERYTLTYNHISPTTHFIRPRNAHLFSNVVYGRGSGGNVISLMGDVIFDSIAHADERQKFAGLMLLDEGFEYVNTTTTALARWVGQVGGSYIIGSLGYNGWAALQSAPIEVFSTGGRMSSCYKPYYALGFVPLVFSTIGVMFWAFLLLPSGSLFGTQMVKAVYGGVRPYAAAICPGAPPKDTLLAWESSPQCHLQLISKSYPVTGDAHGTALEYLRSPP